jgi:hypothetical protein
MRRASSFFVVSTLLLLVGVVLALAFGAETEEETVGCGGSFAIVGGLAYVIWPEHMTKVLFGVVTVPLWSLGVALSILGFFGTLAVCGAELLLPLALGLLLVYRASSDGGLLVGALTTILYLTAWIALRRQQWRLIKETWQTAGRMYEVCVQPIFDLAERINDKADDIGDWVKD